MYIWDENNLRKLARHRVTKSEVHEVLSNDPILWEEQVSESGEIRYMELGYTNAARVLVVIWTARDNLVRPITAFDPDPVLREEFEATYWEDKIT